MLQRIYHLFPAWQRGPWSASSDPWICNGWCVFNKNRFTSASKAPSTVQKRYVSFRQHVLQEKFGIMLRRLYRTLAKNACPGCSKAKWFVTRQFHSAANAATRQEDAEGMSTRNLHIPPTCHYVQYLNGRRTILQQHWIQKHRNYQPSLSMSKKKTNPLTRQESAKTVKPT